MGCRRRSRRPLAGAVPPRWASRPGRPATSALAMLNPRSADQANPFTDPTTAKSWLLEANVSRSCCERLCIRDAASTLYPFGPALPCLNAAFSVRANVQGGSIVRRNLIAKIPTMPFELLWPTPRVALRRFHGHLTEDEFKQAFEAIMSDARFDDLAHNLVDLSPVRSISVSDEALELLAAMAYGASRSNATLEVGVVAPHAGGQGLLRRYLAMKLTRYPVHVFDSYEEANAWLAASCAGVQFQPDGRLVPL